MPDLKGRDFLTLADFTTEEILHVLDTADAMKAAHKAGKGNCPLIGRTVAMIFQKPSTRTRVSFQTGVWQLGGMAISLSPNELQLGRGETIADTARVLARYVDAIVARVFAHDDLIELAHHATVPVINALSDLTHPCQILADLQTIRERFGRLKGLKVAYVGDGNNVAHSLLLGCSKVGVEITVATPRDYAPDPRIVRQAAAAAGGRGVTVATDPYAAVRGADVVYTDTWTSMGQEGEHDKRVADFAGFQVNKKMLSAAAADVIVMHCLPAHRGEEITGDVLDGERSVVFDEAENRLHAQKALLTLLLA